MGDVCVCVCVCVYVCMYVRTYVCMNECTYVCVCMYICIYVCAHTHTHEHTQHTQDIKLHYYFPILCQTQPVNSQFPNLTTINERTWCCDRTVIDKVKSKYLVKTCPGVLLRATNPKGVSYNTFYLVIQNHQTHLISLE
jgi:hypothetical protein